MNLHLNSPDGVMVRGIGIKVSKGNRRVEPLLHEAISLDVQCGGKPTGSIGASSEICKPDCVIGNIFFSKLGQPLPDTVLHVHGGAAAQIIAGVVPVQNYVGITVTRASCSWTSDSKGGP